MSSREEDVKLLVDFVRRTGSDATERLPYNAFATYSTLTS
jgi:hypothetical protein